MFDKNEDTCWNSDQVSKIKAGVKGGGGGELGCFYDVKWSVVLVVMVKGR